MSKMFLDFVLRMKGHFAGGVEQLSAKLVGDGETGELGDSPGEFMGVVILLQSGAPTSDKAGCVRARAKNHEGRTQAQQADESPNEATGSPGSHRCSMVEIPPFKRSLSLRHRCPLRTKHLLSPHTACTALCRVHGRRTVRVRASLTKVDVVVHQVERHQKRKRTGRVVGTSQATHMARITKRLFQELDSLGACGQPLRFHSGLG